MRAFKFVIPVMLLVGGFGWMKLTKEFQEVPGLTRLAIIIGAMILSGVISYFLFPKDEGEKS
ncbi:MULTISPECIES: histidine kinase [unclassified Sporosarcina]|uniref:histidine kinase n=1 Tax=unclassified Sporosarcina TaxID=2647733 RepID=UPI001647B0F8|nr:MULTISPECIES: histidine kinase [unclassified Sporosarcina]MBO0587251.1 histidine kinase [Sporosarcina sp. E16_8]MBO0600890.1 histidine kinase [Sporosarcina sp. E16_3]